MSTLMQRLGSLDGSTRACARREETRRAKADRLLLTALCLAVLTSAALPSLATR